MVSPEWWTCPMIYFQTLSLESALVHVRPSSIWACMGYGATIRRIVNKSLRRCQSADGWTRDMQNFSVLVDGHCPIVGRVSNGQITIRLPKVYPLGTKVT